MNGSRTSEEMRQLILDLDRSPTFDIEDFLVSPSNDEAFHQMIRWPDWPAHMLTLTGPPGSGKSHLASIWARRSGASIINEQDVIAPEALSGHSSILVEDCDRAQRPEAELFHLINHVKETGGWLLLTARTNPDLWGVRTPDLLSRLRLSPLVQIGRPNSELLRSVLVKLFTDRQIKIDEDTIGYAALHLEQSLEAVTRFVQAIDAASLSSGRRITRPLVSATVSLLQRDSL